MRSRRVRAGMASPMIGVAPTVASREVQALLWPRVHGDYAGRTLGPCAYTAGVKARAWKEIIDQWKWSNSEVDPISQHGRSQQPLHEATCRGGPR